MTRIIQYVIHDPIANVEEILQNFDKEWLQKAEEGGLIFVAVHSDGARSIVKACDIEEPLTFANQGGVELVLPAYVDERTEATVACFDALASIVDPQPVAISDGNAEHPSIDPLAAFMAAVEKLRALERKGEER